MSEESLLVDMEQYLFAGVHIGTQIKTKSMEPYIFRVRPDGLFVLDVRKTDERIRVAAKFIARYEPDRVAAVTVRQYGQNPVRMFAKATRVHPIVGRFIPGTFTNPTFKHYIEPDLIIITDPKTDAQALREAKVMRVPVVSLCDTDNIVSNVDLVIPTNNKGRRALALVYWLLARQVLRERGELGPEEDLPYKLSDFETRLKKE
ncbi:MAG: 30S ribosomal protein S2 [Candidatus Odinarchaeota archaeon]|nr:30S ribosomal protein S2 [Candidatus Odinarchaeota archaeon]